MKDIIQKTRDEFLEIKWRHRRSEDLVANNSEHIAAILKNKAEMEELIGKRDYFEKYFQKYFEQV